MKIDRKKSRDTGLIFAIVIGGLACYYGNYYYLIPAISLGVIAFFLPFLLKPVAWIWFLIGELMGAVMTRIVLSVVFFALLFPIALLTKVLGKDSMRLRLFKQSSKSLFIIRNYTFTKKDLENPF